MSNYPPPTAPGQLPAAYPSTQNPVYPQQPQPYTGQPPQHHPQVGQQSVQANVVVAQPVVVSTPAFRDYPVTVTDSNGQQVQTVLEYRAGILTWLIAGVIFIFLLELGLCWLAFIPFLIRDLKDVYHITPTDGKVVGVYKRLA